VKNASWVVSVLNEKVSNS